MPSFCHFFILFFLSLPGYSQGDLEKDSLSPGGGKVIIRGGNVPRPQPSVSPQESQNQADNEQQSLTVNGEPSDNEDATIQEIESARAKQMAQMQKIERSVEPLKNPVLNPIEEIKRLGHKQLDFNALLDKRVIVILRKAFKDGLLSHLPEPEVTKLITEKMKGTWLESVVHYFPSLLPFFVDLARDKSVFHGLLTLFERREDLKTYAYIWLVIFIFGLFVKRRLVKPKWNFFRRFRWNMSINFFFSLISLFIFYFMFSIEVDPFLQVLLKQF